VPSGKIARVVGLLALLVLAYIPLGAVLLNNASAAYFPRQLTVLLLTGAFASLAAAVLWRRPRFLLTTLLAIAAAALVSQPGLRHMRLEVFATLVPVAADMPRDDAARCFCTTRASLHELFGPPDYMGDGDRGTARIYAYERDLGGKRLVLYELRGRTGADDRVVAIRSERLDPSGLDLVPWGDR